MTRGAEFDDLYVFPPLLEACCRVIGRPFKLTSLHARTLRPRTPAQELRVDVRRDSADWPLLGFVLMVDEFRADPPVFVGAIGPRQADLDNMVRRLQVKTPDLVFAYEAGPCGYGRHRYLTGQGFSCQVGAPSLIPKTPGDKVKTDRRDAIDLARLRYLAKIVCPTATQQIVCQESVRAVDEQVDRVHRLEAELLERAPAWRLYPVVQALQALRGVQFLVATTVVAELGDLTRFDSPRQLRGGSGRSSSLDRGRRVDGSQSGGTQSTDLSRINRRCDWLHLGVAPSVSRQRPER